MGPLDKFFDIPIFICGKKFKPEPDITAYELSVIMYYVATHTLSRPTGEKLIDVVNDPILGRHFKKEGE